MTLKTRKVTRLKSHYLVVVVLILIALAAAALLPRRKPKWDNLRGYIEQEQKTQHEEDDIDEGIRLNCQDSRRSNLFSGKWVLDRTSFPLNEEGRCSFMRDEFACHLNGRRDSEYEKWRWQSHGCDLPRYDGTALLDKLRGKKMIFVGDSVNRNQWVSFLCLLEPYLHQSTPKSVKWEDKLFSFSSAEYNATIGFYWSPLLVESNCDNPNDHKIGDRVVKITSIENHARHWTDADILVFDSFAWWLQPNMTFLWGSFDSPDAIKKTVGMMLRRYEMALNTWSEWLETNIDRSRTHVFFMSLSPTHFVGDNFVEKTGNCYNVTDPNLKPGYQVIQKNPEMINAARSAIRTLRSRGVSVQYLNITTLSDYRIDGHPSVYKKTNNPPEMVRANPKGYSDCLHWCLPGVPDVWNQILYSYILKLP